MPFENPFKKCDLCKTETLCPIGSSDPSGEYSDGFRRRFSNITRKISHFGGGRLSKSARFVAFSHPFMARTMDAKFQDEVDRLHGKDPLLVTKIPFS